MELVLLTGMSGSGKSKVSDYLEDMGFFCIDNLPPSLVAGIVSSFHKVRGGRGPALERLALVIDARAGEFLTDIPAALANLDDLDLPYRLIFLDASDATLLSRYKQTRRNHPLATGAMGIPEAIRLEREKLDPLRNRAHDIIDTSNFSTADLRDYIYKLLSHDDRADHRMSIRLVSFGFKYGLPLDCDIVQDVRFIPNPYYNPQLRPLTGLDLPVREEVFSYTQTKDYVDRFMDLLQLLLPHYIKEGKVRLTIGIGCTGGRHRSVAITEEVSRRLQSTKLELDVYHRDLRRDPGNITKRTDYQQGGSHV